MDENYTNDQELEEEKEVAGESKEDKFKRVATPRVQKIIKAIDTLGNCSGSGYGYTEDQVEKMFGAIENKLEETKARFQKKKNETKEFSF